MNKPRFSIAHPDVAMQALVNQTGQRTLAVWALECVARVMPCFKAQYPDDPRPENALRVLQDWIDSGVFRMAIIRQAALACHAAAREMDQDSAARSVARAAGQAVATAHVTRHAGGSAQYAQQAVFRAALPPAAVEAVNLERDWQYRRLLELTAKSGGRTPLQGGQRPTIT
jgi:hypothetical protein